MSISTDIAVCHGLQARNGSGVGFFAEQVGKALLRPQKVVDRHLAADLGRARHFTALCLEHREEATFVRQSRQTDGVVRGRAPSQRTGNKNVDVARAADAHGFGDLVFQVTQVRHRGRGDIRNLMRHRNLRQVLALTEDIAGIGADRHRRGRAGRRWRGAGALHASVHVGLVVVADVKHIVVAFEHARQAAKANVGGAAVAALGDNAHIAAALDAHSRRNAGGHGSSVAEQRVDPRHLPRCFRVRCGEHFQTASGVGGDQLAVGGLHGRVDGISCTQRLATALAGAVTRVQRILALSVGLNAALVGIQQAIAHGERAGLVELDGSLFHDVSLFLKTRCRCRAECPRLPGPSGDAVFHAPTRG